MTAYILKNIDTTFWLKVKARAKKDGHSLRFVLLQLLDRYVRKGL